MDSSTTKGQHMRVMKLLTEIDGHEVRTIGVYPDFEQAKQAALEDDLRYADTAELQAEGTAAFYEAFGAADSFADDSVRWESGSGSRDYQIEDVQVHL
jgi:hypothetical protein